jgi:hypothetical protein
MLASAINPTGKNLSADHIAQKSKERLESLQTIDRLESLAKNPEHQWFLERLRAQARECEEKARDIDNLPPEKRDAYAQRYFGLNEALTWPEKQLKASRVIVANIEREFGQLDEA